MVEVQGDFHRISGQQFSGCSNFNTRTRMLYIPLATLSFDVIIYLYVGTYGPTSVISFRFIVYGAHTERRVRGNYCNLNISFIITRAIKN